MRKYYPEFIKKDYINIRIKIIIKNEFGPRVLDY